ncbi:MAG: AMP-binding protein, partial [Deltaproteobacteria bacterium]|nr:AMP-binding protein [Deltaproteobacteria bacterium]
MGNPRYGSFILKYLNLLVFKKKTLGKVFEQIAAQRGDEAGVIFEGQKVGYREVNRRANRRANLFRSLGVGKGDVVALVMENRLEFLETVVGLSKLGGVTALINYNLKGTALAHCINISGANRIIVGAECVQSVKDALPELERVAIEDIYVDTYWKEGAGVLKGANNLNEMLEKASGENPVSPPLGSKDLVLYIYTSGTTGLPKAARISHYRWFGAGLAFGYYGLVLDTSDTMYCPLPLYHSNGILIAFSSAVQNGANFVITRRFSASGFWKEATETGATSFIYIGELLRYLVNQEPGKYDKAHKVTRIVGNGLRPDIWPSFVERFGIKHIREFYASTEGNAYTLNLNDKEGSVGQVILKLS